MRQHLICPVGAKVGLDLVTAYFDKTFTGPLSADRKAVDALSYPLVARIDASHEYRTNVALMRNTIQATIYAVAEFIEAHATRSNPPSSASSPG